MEEAVVAVADPFEVTEPPRAKKTKAGSFEALAHDLAAADLKARTTASDAGQARAERSTIAVNAIQAAFKEGLLGSVVRSELLDSGVLKGTVSKIVTVLTALQDGHLTTGDVKSLNGAYNLVKSVHAAHAAAGGVAPGGGIITPGGGGPGTPPMVTVKVTPDEALKIIIDAIKGEKDPDKQFKLGGDWITKCTNAITDALKDGEGEEEE